ncbi:hypothetical protein METHB2_90004 [Candidatus Methylobacter favarea]|uniref:Uncharacterized protein n=1 Tax=Candidatus Methylobacter favarea TaxID=2707345 RepID=A0A8S0YB04_9GAMM|nr:hypothetical protein [Candidatus Methylobacter favarea]CAA9892897.1 hypothetical protein METHB2_90004 [Candidatus Methylobacter favarea]
MIYKGPAKPDDPESYLDFESSLKKYLNANLPSTTDTKAKAAQYFIILKCIKYA